MPHVPQFLSIEAGAAKSFPLSLVQDDGVTVINTTGATGIQALFKRNLSDPDSAAVITVSVANGKLTVTNALTGAITIALVPADTGGITTTTVLQLAVKVTYSSTNEVFGAVGSLTIQPLAVENI
jgi:hypothetical protein